MRVRHLHTYLKEQGLVAQAPLDALSQAVVGVDAEYFLRSSVAVSDVFTEALGGMPTALFGILDRELAAWTRAGITPVFVFSGIAPSSPHRLFHSLVPAEVGAAWRAIGSGDYGSAAKFFAKNPVLVTDDVLAFVMHHLSRQGYSCICAPYLAGAQLCQLAEHGVCQAVFAQPGAMMFGCPRVVTAVDFNAGMFEWVDLTHILTTWDIARYQFVDACMLAGTEFCLTYPYLNLEHFNPAQTNQFCFYSAVGFIRQAPLTNWLQTFPSAEMRDSYLEGYRTCELLVRGSPVLRIQDMKVMPVGNPSWTTVRDVLGAKLPDQLYLLVFFGVLSPKLPAALATQRWEDSVPPLADTSEYRDVLRTDLVEIRQRALGLIARRLHSGFMAMAVTTMGYFEQTIPVGQLQQLRPAAGPKLRWVFTREELHAEIIRQGAAVIDCAFCLRWHRHQVQIGGNLYRELQMPGGSCMPTDATSLAALVHFMLLENLSYFSEAGYMTYHGECLGGTPHCFQEAMLTAFQMLGFGVLDGEPYQPAEEMGTDLQYPTSEEISNAQRSRYLISRVVSLLPMRLVPGRAWGSEVDFDLSAFHAVVGALKKGLRQLTEASLANVLLRDISLVRLVPPGVMKPVGDEGSSMSGSYMFPSFCPPRACMGIVMKYFLHFEPTDPQNPTGQFEHHARMHFPCCVDPVGDLRVSLDFWCELKRCVDVMGQHLEGWRDFAKEMDLAGSILQEKRYILG
mmetsp:Transcript_43019/g.113106  ORF Transcript_43019/g.113106 Transcript_43019/m.113106 type:complete len:735 (+) Transcript_43019:72-2276(+)